MLAIGRLLWENLYIKFSKASETIPLKQLDIIISILFWIDLDSVSDPDPQGSASFSRIRIGIVFQENLKSTIFTFWNIKHNSK